jgi:hypothetical protein
MDTSRKISDIYTIIAGDPKLKESSYIKNNKENQL